MTIPQQLIENALALTGKTIDFCNETIEYEWMNGNKDYSEQFSIKNFCYYLLSPEFIENYVSYIDEPDVPFAPNDIGKAIYEYQKGNHSHLMYLLEKIGK